MVPDVTGPLRPVQLPSATEVNVLVAAKVAAIWDEAPIEAKAATRQSNAFGIVMPGLYAAYNSPNRARFKGLVEEYEQTLRRVLPLALVRYAIESGNNRFARARCR